VYSGNRLFTSNKEKYSFTEFENQVNGSHPLYTWANVFCHWVLYGWIKIRSTEGEAKFCVACIKAVKILRRSFERERERERERDMKLGNWKGYCTLWKVNGREQEQWANDIEAAETLSIERHDICKSEIMLTATWMTWSRSLNRIRPLLTAVGRWRHVVQWLSHRQNTAVVAPPVDLRRCYGNDKQVRFSELINASLAA